MTIGVRALERGPLRIGRLEAVYATVLGALFLVPLSRSASLSAPVDSRVIAAGLGVLLAAAVTAALLRGAAGGPLRLSYRSSRSCVRAFLHAHPSPCRRRRAVVANTYYHG